MSYLELIYYVIGDIINTIQYIEWNLCLKLDIDTLSSITLGQLKTLVIDNDLLKEEDVYDLYKILERRNDLVHKYFKRLDFEKHENNTGFLENQYRYLLNFKEQVEEFNEKLL